MQIPERPFDGNAPDDGTPSYQWLDEWLCEYVDGTMDPSLEAVFEQYVEANPELEAHVRRLRQTRELLGGCEESRESLVDPAAEVATDVEEDVLQSPPAFSESVRERPTMAVGIVSSIAVALVVGFLAGSMLVDPESVSPPPISSVVDKQASSQQTVRSEAPPRPGRGAPLSETKSSLTADESIVLHSASAPPSGRDTLKTFATSTTTE